MLSKSIFSLDSCRAKSSYFHFVCPFTTSADVAESERIDHLFYYAANNSHIGFVNNFEWQPNRFHWRQTTTKLFFFSISSLFPSFRSFVSILGLRYLPLTFRKFSVISDKQQAFLFAFFSLDDFAIKLFSLFKMNITSNESHGIKFFLVRWQTILMRRTIERAREGEIKRWREK